MDIATISLLLALIGCIVGLSSRIRLYKNDSGDLAAMLTELTIKVDHLEKEFNSLKEENKDLHDKFQKSYNDFISEKTEVITLHDRLDSLGAYKTNQHKLESSWTKEDN